MGVQEIYAIALFPIMAIYGFIIIAFTLGLLKIHRGVPSCVPQTTRIVSIIIPVRNEEKNIHRILGEMRRQDFPKTFMEVIVTDDFSEDSSMAIVGSFANQYPQFPLMVVRSPSGEITAPGKKRAIERAVARAKGEILLLTDADTTRGPGWVSSMVSRFGTAEIQMALGPVFFCMEENLLQKIQSLEFLGIMGVTAGSAALGYPVMCNGANLAYRRDAFLQTGGFSGNHRYASGDDQFMMSAIRKHFGPRSLVFNFNSVATVGTGAESTLQGFLNQRFRWVSKSRGYSDPFVILVGLVTWLTAMMLLGGLAAGIFFPKILFPAMLLWSLKIALEFPMVWMMSRFFGKEKLLKYYLPAQVFQLVYVPLAGLFGLFLPYRWKGRRG